MLTIIPLYAKAIIIGAILTALTAGYFTWRTHERNIGEVAGKASIQSLWDDQKKKDVQAELDESIRRAQESTRISTEYFDRVQVVREKAKTIIKEVVKYVPAQADADCVINNGFVVLHETAAASNNYAGSAGGSYDAPSGITLSYVGETVAGNYEICHENSAKLAALQEWVRAMERGK